MQAHSKCLKSYICILYVAYMLFFSSDVQYILGSVCWLLRVDGGEAGILELIYGYKKRKETQHRTKTLSHCQAQTFAYQIHIRPIDCPCSRSFPLSAAWLIISKWNNLMLPLMDTASVSALWLKHRRENNKGILHFISFKWVEEHNVSSRWSETKKKQACFEQVKMLFYQWKRTKDKITKIIVGWTVDTNKTLALSV